MRRKYKSGSSWALWRWSDIEGDHITRLHLLKTPWFAIALHWLHGPDPDKWLHDHPVSFLSIILRGGYLEVRQHRRMNTDRLWDRAVIWRKWFNWIWASPHDQHRILLAAPHTLTLCLMGPKRREWGFHTDSGWVHWKEYYAAKTRSNDDAGADGTSRSGHVDGSAVA